MMMFSWVLVPYRLVGRHQRFGETYSFHLFLYVSPKRWYLPTRLHSPKTQKNIIILTAVKTSSLILSLSSALKMEAVCFTETLASADESIRHENSEDHLLHRRENLKSVLELPVSFLT
jgi:hypothetical protein